MGETCRTRAKTTRPSECTYRSLTIPALRLELAVYALRALRRRLGLLNHVPLFFSR